MKTLYSVKKFFMLACLLLCAAALPGLHALPSRAESAKEEPTVILVVLEPRRTDTPIDLFLNAYGGTVLSERTVIAPGTENAVSVRFTEPNGVAFSYKAYVKAEVLKGGEVSDTELPLTLSANGGAYKAFSDWFSEGDGILVSSGSLSAGKQGSVDFSWRWEFERGDDAGDVALSAFSDLSAIVRVVVITEAEAPQETTEAETTEAPTEMPTEAPTDTPTEAPTDAPTDAPTKTPTESPTKAPTKAPSTTAPTKPPGNPGGTTPFGVEDSPAGIIVILILAAATGIVLIILHRRKRTRNE